MFSIMWIFSINGGRTFSFWVIWPDEFVFGWAGFRVCCIAINVSAASRTVPDCIFSSNGVVFSSDREFFQFCCTYGFALQKCIMDIENWKINKLMIGKWSTRGYCLTEKDSRKSRPCFHQNLAGSSMVFFCSQFLSQPACVCCHHISVE